MQKKYNLYIPVDCSYGQLKKYKKGTLVPLVKKGDAFLLKNNMHKYYCNESELKGFPENVSHAFLAVKSTSFFESEVTVGDIVSINNSNVILKVKNISKTKIQLVSIDGKTFDVPAQRDWNYEFVKINKMEVFFFKKVDLTKTSLGTLYFSVDKDFINSHHLLESSFSFEGSVLQDLDMTKDRLSNYKKALKSLKLKDESTTRYLADIKKIENQVKLVNKKRTKNEGTKLLESFLKIKIGQSESKGYFIK